MNVDFYYDNWSDATPGCFSLLGERDFLYRVTPKKSDKPTDLPKKYTTKFENEHVEFVVFFGKNERYLGFGFHAKVALSPFHQQQHVMFVDSKSVGKHEGIEYLVEDFTQMFLARSKTDGPIGYSYWLSTKRKESIL